MRSLPGLRFAEARKYQPFPSIVPGPLDADERAVHCRGRSHGQLGCYGAERAVTPHLDQLVFTVHPPNYGEPEEMKKQKMCYLAIVSFLESQVGRLIRSLEEHKLLDETIIVMFSDHGFHLGEHGQWHKFTLFEESTRVPLILRVPGMTAPGSVTDRIVELVDLFPTLQELCETDTPALVATELYNLQRDPDEEINQAGNPEYEGTRRRLSEQLEGCRAK